MLGLTGMPEAKGKQGKSAEPPEPDEPTLILKVSPRHGFKPLDVTLYARLDGLREGTTRFCHAGIEWLAESVHGRVMRSTEDARCIHPKELKRIDHSYTKHVHLSNTGIYRYQVILHLKDGGEILSNKVDVRVMSNR